MSTFKAVTWNFYSGTPTKTLKPILIEQLKRGVSVFYQQEAGGEDIDKMHAELGLQTFLHPSQWRISWVPLDASHPNGWVKVNAYGLNLSDVPYYSKGSTKKRYSEAADVILSDRFGQTLEAVCFHTPPFVQVRETGSAPRRLTAFEESLRSLETMNLASKAKGFLAAGDSNWDPDTGIGNEEINDLLLAKDGTLRALLSGNATHGRVREIDYFLVDPQSGVRPVRGSNWTAPGGGDHKLSGWEFAWR